MDDLKKLTKAELIDHIEDLEGISEHQKKYQEYLKELQIFAISAISINAKVLARRNSIEELFLVVGQIQSYKRIAIVIGDYLTSKKGE